MRRRVGKWLGALLLLLFLSESAVSQHVNLGDSKTAELIDSLLIDRDSENWSLRLFTNAKEQRFSLRNNDQKLTYAPNNPFGTGIGFATQKVIADLTFNIKGQTENPTERFDLQVDFILKKKHLFDVFFQSYQGFDLRNSHNNVDDFREDLKSISSGISYIYLFNREDFSLASLKSGLSREKKTMFAFGLGGFVVGDDFSADSSIVHSKLDPLFNEEAQITNLSSYGVGVQVGGYSLLTLASNFFISLNITSGIGLSYKKVETEKLRYKPTELLMYRIGFFGAIGYVGKHFYTNVTMGMSSYLTGLDFENSMFLNITNAKLVFGYRLIRRK